MIESWPGIPAFVRDRYLAVAAANPLARELSATFHEGVNLARTTVDADPRRESPRSDLIAKHVAGTLRESLSRHEADVDFEQIVDELGSKSDAFARAWADQVTLDDSDSFVFSNDVVGPMALVYQQFNIPGSFDLTLVVWRPADSNSRVALARLAEIVSGSAEA